MRTLSEALTQECSEMNDEEALTHCKGLTVTVDGVAKSGYVLSYLATINKLTTIRDLVAGDSALKDSSDAVIVTLEGREGFDFSEDGPLSLLAGFVAGGVITQAESDNIRALGQTESAEFPGVRMVDIIGAR